jgi:hypothetical protein
MDRTSAKVRIPMPDAYVYGLMGVVDDECGLDAERVVFIMPIVTRITDMICTKVYLANEINIIFQFKTTIHEEKVEDN